MLDAAILLALSPTLPVQAQAVGSGGRDAAPRRSGGVPYSALYTERSETSSFNVEVTRGMALDDDGTDLFTIHSYASSLLRFDLDALGSDHIADAVEPDDVWPTLVDPVAVAVCDDEVYVLGQGTHGLARHDGVTGRILDVFAPDDFDEPADLVIDHDRREAYVSCMGSDAVVRIRLGAPGSGERMSEIERWRTTLLGPTDFMLKRPRFLHWHDGDLYVAPFIAGNNTMTVGTTPLPNQGGGYHWDRSVLDGGKIYDAYDPASPVRSSLPDVDLVRIRPSTVGAATIEPIFRDAGSQLMAHGLDPASGKYWMLGIDGLNVQTDAIGVPLDTEERLRGRFARNTLVVSRLPKPSVAPRRVTDDVIDLDDPMGHGAYRRDRALPNPYALEFGGPNGLVAVASSTLSRVRLFDPAGQAVAAVPPMTGSVHRGRITRDLLFRGDELFLYCQGTANILVWPVAGGAPDSRARVELSLLSDPTPETVRGGRDSFYDATRSAHSRSTCATCHPGGESDLLAWPLKQGTHDFKDQTVTLSLKGLRETFPYHWRGERALADFNDAFRDLLGASDALDRANDEHGRSELDDFLEFLFTLRPAANPLERLDRTAPASAIVPGMPADAPVEPVGDVANGLDLFLNKGRVCAECHMLPTGSVGSVHNDNTLTFERHVAWNRNLETIQLTNFLQMRDQRMVRVAVPDPAPGSTGTIEIDRPFLGFGFQHTGAFTSLFHFMHARFAQVLTAHIPGATAKDRAKAARDISAFLRVLDTGTPPAAHWSAYVSRETEAETLHLIQAVVLPQARRGWIDLVVHGTMPSPDGAGALQDVSWWYDRETNRFVPDLVGLDSPGPRPLSYFFDFAQHPTVSHVFLGSLRGRGEQLGIDFDRDGIVNGDEGPLERWNRDRDGDGYPDGYEREHGGTEGDPLQGPDDTRAPSLRIDPATGGPDFELLLARATHAEFAFRADEEVRWELVARSHAASAAGVPTVRASGPTFAREHTAHLHGLRASEESGVLSSYDIELKLYDRAGLVSSFLLPHQVTTTIDRGRPINRNGNTERVVVNSIETADESYDDASGTFSARITVEAGNHQELDRGGVAGRAVIVQPLYRRSLTRDWRRFPLSDVVHTGPNWSNLVLPRLYDNAPYPAVRGGPLVILGVTDANGEASARIILRNVEPDDEIAISIVALPRADENGSNTLSDPSFPLESFFDWLMPVTEPALRVKRIR